MLSITIKAWLSLAVKEPKQVEMPLKCNLKTVSLAEVSILKAVSRQSRW